jgi:hypothetical protein
MLRRALQRGDATSVSAALNALIRFIDVYVHASETNPDARVHHYEAAPVTGWLAAELRHELVSAGTYAVAQGAPEEEPQAIAQVLAHAGSVAIERGWIDEPQDVVTALMELGTCIQQATPYGVLNLYAPAAEYLARLEGDAERSEQNGTASNALAGWLLVAWYWHRQFGVDLTLGLERGIGHVGPSPPVADARREMATQPFQRRWVNKQAAGSDRAADVLERLLRKRSRSP